MVTYISHVSEVSRQTKIKWIVFAHVYDTSYTHYLVYVWVEIKRVLWGIKPLYWIKNINMSFVKWYVFSRKNWPFSTSFILWYVLNAYKEENYKRRINHRSKKKNQNCMSCRNDNVLIFDKNLTSRKEIKVYEFLIWDNFTHWWT